MLLHTVNKSPFERNALESCLQHAQKGSAILLIEDGVYGATKGHKLEAAVRDKLKTVKVYVLKPDLEARGILDHKMDGVELVDYNGFVDLVVKHSSVQSWL